MHASMVMSTSVEGEAWRAGGVGSMCWAVMSERQLTLCRTTGGQTSNTTKKITDAQYKSSHTSNTEKHLFKNPKLN